MKKISWSLLCVALFMSPVLLAQDAVNFKSSYVGEEKRVIKSLSENDIQAILKGEGWGLAKAAELNGYPGPLHVLEMADELTLSKGQKDAVEDLYKTMKVQAIEAGEWYIQAEADLDNAFRQYVADTDTLGVLIKNSASAFAKLREVHLDAHLEMVQILTVEQVDRYNALRGYTDDPCSAVPEGHDPTMWKKHNGCTE